MIGLRNTMHWKKASIILMLFILTSCMKFKFKRDDPSRIGVWYPSYAISNIDITKEDYSEANISFGGEPINIIAVGDMSWNPYAYRSSYYETALLEVNFKDNSVGRYYARTDWLKAHGRIEFTGTKTSFDYFIGGITDFTFSTLGVIVLILFIIFTIRVFLISRKRTITTSDSFSYESNDRPSDYDTKEEPIEEKTKSETDDQGQRRDYNYNYMFANSDDLKHLALAISNNETSQYDEWVRVIEDDNIKYLALSINNNERSQYDEWVREIEDDNIKYLALSINNNERSQYDEWVREIKDNNLKHLALAINNNETSQYEEWVKEIDNDNLKYLALAINNNETSQFDEWVREIG